jgi:hypothetical protein
MAIALVAAACSGGSSGGSAEAPPGIEAEIAVEVPIPPERQTPFCQGMNALAERLDDNPPSDTRAFIIDTYASLVPDVPPEILPQFEAVLDELRQDPPVGTPSPTSLTAPSGPTTLTPSTSVSPTTQPPNEVVQPTGSRGPTNAVDESTTTISPEEAFDAEGRLPGEQPVERLNDYVQFSCRGIDNNPGPPATPPLEDVTTVDS